jgi:hypothetical protein
MALGLGSWFVLSALLVVFLAFAPIANHLTWRSFFSPLALFFAGVFVFFCGYLPSVPCSSLMGASGAGAFSHAALPWVGVPYV